MQNTDSNQSVLILTGMHRSGTSLTASLLQSAGVDLGKRLMGSEFGEGNPKGHYEDLDFVEFHQNVLQSQGVSIAGWTKEGSIKVQEQYREKALALVEAKYSSSQIWGWKDPRTTLFLEFWLEIIPEAKFVFVYRSPWEVIDSLYRRGDLIFINNPNFAIAVWQNYNQVILDFCDRNPDRAILFRIEDIISNCNFLTDSFQEKFGLTLQPPQQLYEDSLFNSQISRSHRSTLIKQYFPEAFDLYLELHQRATLNNSSNLPLVNDVSQLPSYQDWVLQDWLDLRHKSKELKQTQSELTNSQEQLHQTQEELTNSQQQLQQTQSELTNSQEQLHQTQEELTNSQQQLQQTQTELSQTQVELTNSQQQLHQTQSELTNSQQQLHQTQIELTNSQQQLYQTQHQKAQLQNLVTAMESSKFWQLRQLWLSWKKAFNLGYRDELYQAYLNSLDVNSSSTISLGNSTLNYRIARIQDKGWKYIFTKIFYDKLPKLTKSLVEPEPIVTRIDEDIPSSKDSKYQQWLNKHYPKKIDLNKMSETLSLLSYQPTISVIVPVYNPPEDFLRQAIESVLKQVYPHWELCLADDCSTKPYVKEILEEYTQQDSRIKVVFREENGHISRASNSALDIATGKYIALLDHDDLLAPHALYEVVRLLNQHPEADMIYSDEDKIDKQNLHREPFFKMDWCPDSFLSRMYTCHLGVYRRSIVKEIGNFRVGFEGSQDYDLVLRFTEKTDKIFHIPNILYHWRIHSTSAAADPGAKPYAYEASHQAISEAISRRKEPGKVIPIPGFPGLYTIRYDIATKKLVSIIIPTRDLAKTLNTCLKSIFEKTTYPQYEVVVIDNGSKEEETFKCFEDWQNKEPDRFKCYRHDIPFNYSQINNYAVQKAQGEYLLFLNNDTEVITTDWIEAMIEQAQRASIGAVGALLLYPDDTIQHAGVVLGIGGVAGHSHKYLPSILPGYISQAITTNNYSAVTGACLMCRREVFEEVGGFEEKLTVAFNDIDFCLKLIERGYRNIYLPHVALYHYESKSRGQEDTVEKQIRFTKEINYMQTKWEDLIENDPCYNPHLTRNSEDYSIEVK
jgi:GT2 family glycosyltransferase